MFFTVLGGSIGEYLKPISPLRGYGINLAGGLLGMSLFSLVAFLSSGPAIWLLVGFGLLLPVIKPDRLAIPIFALVVLLIGIPQPSTFWSPYYRIDLVRLPTPVGWLRASAYSLVSNHSWYQWIVDLSPEFVKQNSAASPNRIVAPYYELPYQLVPRPRRVLILGAGAGNDVASALRHGVEHVDAVEIDPMILKLGQQYHPEHPYDSPRVTAHADDARAFLGKSKQKYDLIVFGVLDSSTLLSSFSSLRLDNYVYTVEGLRSAKAHLADHGTLVLSFAVGRSFAADRLYATLGAAFDAPPAAYFTEFYRNGMVLVEGEARSRRLPQLPEVSREMDARISRDTLLATDSWPFLYLTHRSIPDSVLVTAALFLLMSLAVLLRTGCIAWRNSASHLHFFLLGAGFLFLETKAITQLSLLFGGTWIVNAVVIGAFLIMALVANTLVGALRMSIVPIYLILLVLLVGDFWFPYSAINSLQMWVKLLLGGGWAALPVLFSGVIFSSSLRRFGQPAEALGVNLFGAVLGGLLENAVMIGGTPILKALAIAMYAVSAVALYRSSSTSKAFSSTL
jgi:spermidine synthase